MQVFSKFVAVAVVGVLPAVFAQTTSDCDPTKGCFPTNPGLQGTWEYDFTKNGASSNLTVLGSIDNIKYDSQGLHLPCIKPKDSPSLGTNFYIWYGKVDITMKAAPGAGIISSLVFQSDVRDEIDLEFVGLQTSVYQSNIFRMGDRDVSYPGNGTTDNTNDFHTYTVDWQKDSITWSVDGVAQRVMQRSDPKATNIFPRTPANLRFGSWTAGDKSQPPGTVEWSEGPIDYTKGPFDMVVQNIKITNYNPAVSYKYKDGTGSEDSVEMSNQEVVVTTAATTATVSTTSAKSTKTNTADATTTTSAKSTETNTQSAVTTTKANTTVTSSVGTLTTVKASTTATGSGSGTATGPATTTTQSGAPKSSNAAAPLQGSMAGLSVFALVAAVLAF